MAGERRVLVIGGSDSPLSSASVFQFSIASHPHLLKIDPSALGRLSTSSSGHKLQLSIPDFLTLEEARASIVVLLSKHLRGGSGSFSFSSASQLSDILNNETQTLTIDLEDDLHISKACWTDMTCIGISTLLDYTASVLTKVADAVAALSCEALKADTSTIFNLFMDSGDGFFDKDRAAVVNDLKVLLNGSKLHSDLQFDQVNKIPRIHGHLRSVCESIHSSTRIELNSIPLVTGGVSNYLVTLFSPLAFALQDIGESSRLRAEALVKDSSFPCLVDIFNDGCPGLEDLRDSIMHFVVLKMDKRYIESLHEIYVLSEFVSKTLCWEAALSYISLLGSELIKGQKGIDGGNAKLGKKDKRKKVMGKGTTVLMQFIKDRLEYVTSNITDGDSSALMEKVAYSVQSLFDLKDPDFEHLLQKVKEVVDSNEIRRLPKNPKGTRDFANEQTAEREKAFRTVVNVFKRHCAMGLETPSLELRETLTEKYGEDSKLMYHLDDQGGELLTLRYDLTVPFARYVAMNGLTKCKAYQIGRVNRRDNPSKAKLREFYQGDFNIAGDESVEADFEVIKVLTEVLDELNIGDYTIKLNHRKLLDGLLEICGVPSHKVRTICSSVDKLDKRSLEEIKKEMIEDKGLDAVAVEKIASYVVLKGDPLTLLSQLKKEGSELLKNDSTNQALNDLEKLFKYLDKRQCIEKVVFDLSLARGLDYYTGVIFEAVLKGGPTDIGSVAGGGRMDNLVGMFGTKHVPAVGLGVGIDRIFTIMEQLPKDNKEAPRGVETEVLVSILGDDKSLAIDLVDMCWAAKLKAEYMVNKRLNKHFDRAKQFWIPWMVIVGEREYDKGIVKIKNTETDVEKQVLMCEFVDELIRLVNTTSL